MEKEGGKDYQSANLAGIRYLPAVVKFRLVIEFDPEVQRWSAVFPELPGCASAGDTEQEAAANAKEALALWFEPAEYFIS